MRIPRAINGFDELADFVDEGKEPQITGRQLLEWVGAARRGARVIARINGELQERNLTTEPSFADVWVDVPLQVKRLEESLTDDDDAGGDEDDDRPAATSTGATECVAPGPTNETNVSSSPATVKPKGRTRADAVHRISQLPAANNPIVFVQPGSPLNEATTLMMLKDFSQLPIVHNGRTCKGAVSWQSIAMASALGKSCKTVDACSEPAEEVSWNAGLLDVIPKIVDKGFVLVRGPDSMFQGIVTVADLSLQFRVLSEPFLLLGQIENLVRTLIERSFSEEEIRLAKNAEDSRREINSVHDLTFGEYVRLLERPEDWLKLKVPFDRMHFIKGLEEVRGIRNEVTHFDPDPLEPPKLALLRQFAAFLQRVG